MRIDPRDFLIDKSTGRNTDNQSISWKQGIFNLFYVPGIMQQAQLVVRLGMDIREVIF